MMPKISVIVPVYNVEPYLRRCIDSILAQTYPDFELILVDDESPDFCPAICDEYAQADKRVRVIHKKNGGVSAARNSGLDAAQGEYIAFCDSDDWWDEDFLEQHIQCVDKSSIDMVVSGYRMVDSDKNVVSLSNNTPILLDISQPMEKMNYFFGYMWQSKCTWEVCIRLLKKSIIQSNHIRFCTTCGNYAEDLGFTHVFCLYAQKIKGIDYCGYNYFLRPESMMRTSRTTVKLNQVNEVSKSIFTHIEKLGRQCVNIYPILHFRIMITEYQKIINTPEYQKLSYYIGLIDDNEFNRTQTKRVFLNYKQIIAIYGTYTARQCMLLALYCLHGNWNRYRIESYIAYRFFIKKEKDNASN